MEHWVVIVSMQAIVEYYHVRRFAGLIIGNEVNQGMTISNGRIV